MPSYRASFVSRLILTSAIVFLGTSAIGCGPMYDTRYTMIPPSSSSGRVCIVQCENSKYQCEELEELRKERCEERAESEYNRCEWQTRRSEGRQPKWYECSRDSCSADSGKCEQRYRSCYESCGGRVSSETVCVANCEQARPDHRQPKPRDDYDRYPRDSYPRGNDRY